jgi:hypothetical protein
VFGAALSGVKRDSRDLADGREQPPHQRARYERPQGYEGVPAGPRNMVNGGGGAGGGRRDNRSGEGGKSIFDRVQQNPVANPGYASAMGMPPAAYEAVRSSLHFPTALN